MTVHALERTADFGSKWPIFGAVWSFLSAFAAARDCAAALEMGRRPSDQALAVLGIDPSQFNKIKLN